MAELTRAQLDALANTIKNNTADDSNTAVLVGDMLLALIESSFNLEDDSISIFRSPTFTAPGFSFIPLAGFDQTKIFNIAFTYEFTSQIADFDLVSSVLDENSVTAGSPIKMNPFDQDSNLDAGFKNLIQLSIDPVGLIQPGDDLIILASNFSGPSAPVGEVFSDLIVWQ